jgi:hypothetical protein
MANTADPAGELLEAARKLDDNALAQLISRLQAELETRQEKIPVSPGRTVVDTQRSGAVTDRLEYVRCGKPGCRCERGQLHGPYWYRYQRVGGRLKSTYLGKTRK